MNKIISGAGIGVVGVAAAAIALAPTASADTTNSGLTVSGFSYVVGGTYTLTANAGLGGLTAVFYDNGTEIGRTGSALGQGTAGNVPVTLPWSPTTAGTHTITEKTVDPFFGNVVGEEGPVTVNVSATGSGSAAAGLPDIGGLFGGLSSATGSGQH
ncbi:hypothetical protein [Nocardia stercoris]|uniref:Uncharacterized protein n=1 Tax=Nocardia stercoris TaxID=2483361 RepID=A0A3M2L291_9NOCA|nr:hypothetical protein [Nocardia stercoris]RMI28668.1 hypothetical protein EBN03_28905 [Nocardia stercoris]